MFTDSIILLLVDFIRFFAVEVLLYAPIRPIVDYSVIFLWCMATGTVACASLWSEIVEPDGNYGSPKVCLKQLRSFSYVLNRLLIQITPQSLD